MTPHRRKRSEPPQVTTIFRSTRSGASTCSIPTSTRGADHMNVRSNRLVASLSAIPLLTAGVIVGSTVTSGPIASAGNVIQVTTTEEKIGGPGGCSLQEAILAANHDSSAFTAPGNDAVVINSAC